MSAQHPGLGEDEQPTTAAAEEETAETAAPAAAETPAEAPAALSAESLGEAPGEPPADSPAPETPPEDAPASADSPLSEIAAQLELLARSLEESNRLSTERERIIDRLHAENQQLRQGELQQAVLPVFRDLVRLYDDLRQTARAYASRAEVGPAEAARDFELFAEMVTDILYRQGVERYEAREGEPFSSKEHRVLGAVQTPEPEKDRTVARSVRDGFRSETRVVRLLEAEIYRYAPAPAAAGGGEAAGGGQEAGAA